MTPEEICDTATRCNNAVTQMKNECLAAIEELSALRTTHAVEVHGLRDKADALEFDLCVSKKAFAILSDQRNALREQLATGDRSSRAQVEGLYQETVKPGNTNNALAAANAELRKERDDLKATCSRMNTQIEDLYKACADWREELRDRNSRIEQLMKERDELAAALNAERGNVNRLTTKLNAVPAKPRATLKVRVLQTETLTISGYDLCATVVSEAL